MFVTAPSSEEAQRIARELLQRGLAACVNLVPQVQSLYMWEGKLESAQEVLMMIKVGMMNCVPFEDKSILMAPDMVRCCCCF